MIKIKLATEKPIEDDNHWSYPFSELDYLMEEKEDGAVFLLYDGRLYESDEDTEVDKIREARNAICRHCKSDMCEWCVVERTLMDAENGELEEDEPYIRSSTNGDYGPNNPWDAPGCSVNDFYR